MSLAKKPTKNLHEIMHFKLICFALLCLSSISGLAAEQLPETRPALLGEGPKSLVNLIDTNRLMQRGQKDAAIHFSCSVGPSGDAYAPVTYGRSPDSLALANEFIAECRRATFLPAVFHSKPISSMIEGTIIYGIVGNKPHLRIFLNQEPEHLKSGDDFIAPQLVSSWGDEFRGFKPPPAAGRHSANLRMQLDFDNTGKLLHSRVTFDSTPGMGFEAEIMKEIGKAHFLPGYFRGTPTACSVNWVVIFSGAGHGSYWNPG